ncbi:TetR/AcrR family transcriptional regulator [Micrococcus terreus]|uniref:TetR/AcrR family transcriptional regulator n=1 Tax=Micrococcus terreus TaxID=574650 RepID=UPI0023FA21B9|nr:TetR family transcriptional regulator C-terminal domain-containing protein [Micrococcus terreus]
MDRGARKAQLAEAVWRIIRDRGIGAVSVRSVAEQAGVAVGSLRHVFPTRAELLRFSAELMVQRATDRIRAIPPLDGSQEYALEVVKHLLPLEPDSRAELEVNIALIAESPALPELVIIRDHAYQELAEACTRLVEMLVGRPRDPQLVQQARRLHAIVDGLAIHLLMHPPSEDSGWAIDIVRGELARIPGEAA